MATIIVNIENKDDLYFIKKMLSSFGLKFKVEDKSEEIRLYSSLKKSFKEINEWKQGKITLQNAQSAIREIESDLNG